MKKFSLSLQLDEVQHNDSEDDSEVDIPDNQAQIFQFILQQSQLGLLMVNHSGKIVYSNRKIQSLLQANDDAVIQRLLAKIEQTQSSFHEENTTSLEKKINTKNFINSFLSQLKESHRIVSQSHDFIHSPVLQEKVGKILRKEQKIKTLVNLIENGIQSNEKNQEPNSHFEKGMSNEQFFQSREDKRISASIQIVEKQLRIDVFMAKELYQLKMLIYDDENHREFLVLILEKKGDMLEQKRKLNCISHQLRSPLNCSIGLLEIAKNNIKDAEIIKQYIVPSLTSNHILLNNLNMIIDISEIEMMNFKYEIQQVSLRGVLREVMQILDQPANLKRVDFALDIEEGLDELWSDGQRIRQILISLISNSVQFSLQNSQIDIEVFLNSNQRRMSEKASSNIQSIKQLAVQNEDSDHESKKEKQQEKQTKNADSDSEQGSGKLKKRTLELQNIRIDNNSNHNNSEQDARKPKQIVVRIRDYGVGLSKSSLTHLINENEEQEDVQFRQELRPQPFGIISSIKILEGLSNPQLEQQPLKIISEPGLGCTYEFQLMDFGIHVQNKDQDIRSRSRSLKVQESIELNISEKYYILSQHDNKDEFGIPQKNGSRFNFNDSDVINDIFAEENVSYHSAFNDKKIAPRESIDMKCKMVQRNNHDSSSPLCSPNSDDYRSNRILLQRDFLNEPKLQDSESKSNQFNNMDFILSPRNQLGESQKIYNQDDKQDEANYTQLNNVLIVDDNEFNVMTLECMFQELGYSVDQAFNGQEAVDMFESRFSQSREFESYKLIVMDLDMPVKDGFQSTQGILDFCQCYQINTNIVACSAFVGASDIQRAISVGMTDYLTQPVSQMVVAQLLKKYFPKENKIK